MKRELVLSLAGSHTHTHHVIMWRVVRYEKCVSHIVCCNCSWISGLRWPRAALLLDTRNGNGSSPIVCIRQSPFSKSVSSQQVVRSLNNNNKQKKTHLTRGSCFKFCCFHIFSSAIVFSMCMESLFWRQKVTATASST